jgi:hypothetical protein
MKARQLRTETNVSKKVAAGARGQTSSAFLPLHKAASLRFGMTPARSTDVAYKDRLDFGEGVPLHAICRTVQPPFAVAVAERSDLQIQTLLALLHVDFFLLRVSI